MRFKEKISKLATTIRFLLPYYFIAFVGFFVLVMLFRFSVSPHGYTITEWNMRRKASDTLSVTQVNVPYYEILKKPETVIFYAKLNKKFIEKDYYLYLPQIDSSYLAVYSNNRLVGSYGFSKARTGHFWYQPFIFQLPKDTEEITLEISGVYEVGIDFPPTLIGESQKYKYMILYLLTNVFLLVSSGLALTLSLILYMISKNLTDKKRSVYLHFSMASFLGALWLFDLIPFPDMGGILAILILRKIFVASAYLGLASLIYGLSRQYFDNISIFSKVLILLDILAAGILFLAPNHYHMKVFSNNVAFLLLFNAVYIVVKISETYSPTHVAFSFFFALTVIHDGVAVFLSTNQKLISMYGIIALFAGFSYSLVNEYKDMIVGMSLAYMKSITDPLTGAFNRGALSEINLSHNDALVYIDMNKFKQINDKYGHKVGDEILKILVNTIRSTIRKSDLIIRMGGDEFLVILKECSVEKAREIIENARQGFNKSHELRPDFSYGVVAYLSDLQNSLHEVDKLMYKMKEKEVKEGK
ncbi:MAG: GGDEF domain-containing protein [Fervidobacterium sp.]